jgi:RNA polymerase-binding transcription factor DksA
MGTSATPVRVLHKNLKGFPIMSINLQNQSTDGQIPNGGLVWNRLHSEREQVCEALLRNARRSDQTNSEKPIPSSYEQGRDQILQTRLRLIDEALDRLITGKYGECSICEKWIEDTKLQADAAHPFCLGCEWKSECEPKLEGAFRFWSPSIPLGKAAHYFAQKPAKETEYSAEV